MYHFDYYADCKLGAFFVLRGNEIPATWKKQIRRTLPSNAVFLCDGSVPKENEQASPVPAASGWWCCNVTRIWSTPK